MDILSTGILILFVTAIWHELSFALDFQHSTPYDEQKKIAEVMHNYDIMIGL